MHMSKNGLQNVKWLSEEEEEKKNGAPDIYHIRERERKHKFFLTFWSDCHCHVKVICLVLKVGGESRSKQCKEQFGGVL